jgi:hypothetical protein
LIQDKRRSALRVDVAQSLRKWANQYDGMPGLQVAVRASRNEPTAPAIAAGHGPAGELGSSESTVRLMLGLLIADLGVGGIAGHWGWLGVFPIVTAALRWCPVQAILDAHRSPPAS